MKRIALPELEDFPWFPSVLRSAQTDYLRWLMEAFDVFRAVAPLLQAAMERTGQTHLTDLCSGGGGSILLIKKHLRIPNFSATLSDLYPNLEAFADIQRLSGGVVDFRAAPLDATQLPPDLTGFITIFNGFHHLQPADAQAVLQYAADKRLPIGIFEPIEKSVMQLVVNLFALTVLMWLVMPFVRPFRWSKLFFTYLIPLVPLCTLWDGIASVARLYSQQEIAAMTSAVRTEGYEWQFGQAKHTFGKVGFLIGIPTAFA